MTDTQPPHLTPGPTPAGDIEDELPPSSAEDRKAAAALSSLDMHDDEGGAKQNVDAEAVRKAMDRLGGGGAGKEEEKGKKKEEEVRRVVKVEAGDVRVVVSF